MTQSLEIALLWEASLPYRGLQADVQWALTELLQRFPTTVHLWPAALAGRVVGPVAPRSVAETRSLLQLPSSSVETDVPLVDGIRAALAALNPPQKAGAIPVAFQRLPRKAIIVVASGMDVQMLPRRFVELGDELARAETPVYTVAVSPHNHQLPMLNLAELSFRSHGTFRWVRLQPDQPQGPLMLEQLEALWHELASTEEVTFSGPAIVTLLSPPSRPTELSIDCGVAVSRPRPVHTVMMQQTRPQWRPALAALLALVLAGLVGLLWWFRRPVLRGS